MCYTVCSLHALQPTWPVVVYSVGLCVCFKHSVTMRLTHTNMCAVWCLYMSQAAVCSYISCRMFDCCQPTPAHLSGVPPPLCQCTLPCLCVRLCAVLAPTPLAREFESELLDSAPFEWATYCVLTIAQQRAYGCSQSVSAERCLPISAHFLPCIYTTQSLPPTCLMTGTVEAAFYHVERVSACLSLLGDVCELTSHCPSVCGGAGLSAAQATPCHSLCVSPSVGALMCRGSTL